MSQTRVQLIAGQRVLGGTLTLDASIQQLTDVETQVLTVSILNPTGNSDLYIYNTGQNHPVWILTAGQSISIDIIQATRVYVLGTAADVIYWMGITAE